MEWQAVVLVIQILLLAVGWFLFQQARGELSAKAAETPVLGEIKALQRNIKQLLTDLEQTSVRSSEQLEIRCSEASRLIATLDTSLDSLALLQSQALVALNNVQMAAAQKGPVFDSAEVLIRQSSTTPSNPPPAAPISTPTSRELRHAQVYTLADEGKSCGIIARETGLSEGAVETLLGLRLQQTS